MFCTRVGGAAAAGSSPVILDLCSDYQNLRVTTLMTLRFSIPLTLDFASPTGGGKPGVFCFETNIGTMKTPIIIYDRA